jgi:hypothetical protein
LSTVVIKSALVLAELIVVDLKFFKFHIECDNYVLT